LGKCDGDITYITQSHIEDTLPTLTMEILMPSLALYNGIMQ